MKKSELKVIILEEYKKVLKEDFWRLPISTRGNELYKAVGGLKSFSASVEHGNDVDMSLLDVIINNLVALKKSAKKFKSGEDVPKEYRS